MDSTTGTVAICSEGDFNFLTCPAASKEGLWPLRCCYSISGICAANGDGSLLLVTHPVAGALAWTLLFASFFTVIGLFRLIAATRLKFPDWGWAAFDGAVTLLLGILLWADWPWSGFWFLGLSIGIALLLRGW